VTANLWIGTSGWNYDHWRDLFYTGTKKDQWLQFYSARFNAVEINATFYRLQDKKTFQRWYEQTPDDFRFCIKANRYVTHNKKLLDPVESVRLERQRAVALRHKLSAVLWQLPGKFTVHIDRLRGFIKALSSWREVRHVVEFRHRSWFVEEVADCLAAHDISNCLSDAADWPIWEAVTTDLVYARLHGHSCTYTSSYRRATLQGWARKIKRWLREKRQIHVYFDNDAEGRAPRDAQRLQGLIARAE